MQGNIQVSGNASLLQKEAFSKPPLSTDEHIALMESRGLIIQDKEFAKAILKDNSYYRLSGYMLPFFDKSTNTFIDGTTFEHITTIYNFDNRLKAILMEALEMIEVSFKTKVINSISLRHNDAHRFLNDSLFITEPAFNNVIRVIKKGVSKNKNNVFIKHYQWKYGDPLLPANRMVFQVLAFGEISIVYDALTSGNSNAIASNYHLKFPYLGSWTNALSYLRNLCAHSDRVWNRIMLKKLRIKKFDTYFNGDRDSLFAYLIAICYLLKHIHNGAEWISKFKDFIHQHTEIELPKMGFPENREEVLDSVQ